MNFWNWQVKSIFNAKTRYTLLSVDDKEGSQIVMQIDNLIQDLEKDIKKLTPKTPGIVCGEIAAILADKKELDEHLHKALSAIVPAIKKLKKENIKDEVYLSFYRDILQTLHKQPLKMKTDTLEYFVKKYPEYKKQGLFKSTRVSPVTELNHLVTALKNLDDFYKKQMQAPGFIL